MNKSLTDIMKERHSVRTYSNKPIEADKIEQIESFLSQVSNPWNVPIRMKLIKTNEEGKEQKLGTYGVIKGAKNYLAIVAKNDSFAYEAIGFVFERLILNCTTLGLGTVWLGGTFKKGAFAKAFHVKEDEIFSVISPVGYSADKPSLIAGIFSKSSGIRKEFSEIFYKDNFETPLTKQTAGNYFVPLEMVRMAPSAVNKQPWRIIKQENIFHFYNAGKAQLNPIDMGIAMYHFDAALKEQGLNGIFVSQDPGILTKFPYVTSWCQQ